MTGRSPVRLCPKTLVPIRVRQCARESRRRRARRRLRTVGRSNRTRTQIGPRENVPKRKTRQRTVRLGRVDDLGH